MTKQDILNFLQGKNLKDFADPRCNKCPGNGIFGYTMEDKVIMCSCITKNVRKAYEREARLKKSGLIVPDANKPNIILAGNHNKDNDKEAVQSLDKGLIIRP